MKASEILRIVNDPQLSEWLRNKMRKFIWEVKNHNAIKQDWDGHDGWGVTTDSIFHGFLFLSNIYKYILENTDVELPKDFEINPSPDSGIHFSWREGRTLQEIEQKIPVKKKKMEMLITTYPLTQGGPFYFSYYGCLKGVNTEIKVFEIRNTKGENLELSDYKQKDFIDLFEKLKTLA